MTTLASLCHHPFLVLVFAEEIAFDRSQGDSFTTTLELWLTGRRKLFSLIPPTILEVVSAFWAQIDALAKSDSLRGHAGQNTSLS